MLRDIGLARTDDGYPHPRHSLMPPFRTKVMTDQELADVYAYMQSVPPPVPLANIPILNEQTR